MKITREAIHRNGRYTRQREYYLRWLTMHTTAVYTHDADRRIDAARRCSADVQFNSDTGLRFVHQMALQSSDTVEAAAVTRHE